MNDIAQISAAGHRSKVVDIVRPLGTYKNYKVQLFDDGSLHSVARRNLVKGHPDDMLFFHMNLLFDEFGSYIHNIGGYNVILTQETLKSNMNSQNINNYDTVTLSCEIAL